MLKAIKEWAFLGLMALVALIPLLAFAWKLDRDAQRSKLTIPNYVGVEYRTGTMVDGSTTTEPGIVYHQGPWRYQQEASEMVAYLYTAEGHLRARIANPLQVFTTTEAHR